MIIIIVLITETLTEWDLGDEVNLFLSSRHHNINLYPVYCLTWINGSSSERPVSSIAANK